MTELSVVKSDDGFLPESNHCGNDVSTSRELQSICFTVYKSSEASGLEFLAN